MKDVEHLLRQHGAPLPNALAVETEVRSEGFVAFHTLAVPDWTDGIQSSSSIAEWCCSLVPEQLLELQRVIKTVLPSGKPMQQMLNEALRDLDIGSYMGTFMETGTAVAGHTTIRILFAYRSARLPDIEAINRALHALLTAPGAHSDASDALRALREIWLKGSDRWEGGLMMLSEANLYGPERFPFTSARLADGVPPQAK